jgi:hypothetical protein
MHRFRLKANLFGLGTKKDYSISFILHAHCRMVKPFGQPIASLLPRISSAGWLYNNRTQEAL